MDENVEARCERISNAAFGAGVAPDGIEVTAEELAADPEGVQHRRRQATLDELGEVLRLTTELRDDLLAGRVDVMRLLSITRVPVTRTTTTG